MARQTSATTHERRKSKLEWVVELGNPQLLPMKSGEIDSLWVVETENEVLLPTGREKASWNG